MGMRVLRMHIVNDTLHSVRIWQDMKKMTWGPAIGYVGIYNLWRRNIWHTLWALCLSILANEGLMIGYMSTRDLWHRIT